VPQRRLAAGQRQEVVQAHARDPRPAQVVGDPGGLDAPGQRVDRVEQRGVERVAGADVERDTMK
jgi:hypothetical protein